MKRQMTDLLDAYRERLEGTTPNFSGTPLQQARWHWEAASHHLKLMSTVVCAYHVGFMERLLVEAKALTNREQRKNLALWIDSARRGIQELIDVHYAVSFCCVTCQTRLLSFERPGRAPAAVLRHGNAVYMRDMTTDERLLKYGVMPMTMVDGVVWLEEEQRIVVSCAAIMICTKHIELERMAMTVTRLKEIGWKLDEESKDWQKAWQSHPCRTQGGPDEASNQGN